MDTKDLSVRLRRANLKLMRSKDAYPYGGVLLLGTSEFTDDEKIPCAAVKGLNKYYNTEYVSGLTDSQFRAVIIHETLHIALEHMNRFAPYLEDENDKQLMELAMDLQVNDIIHNFEDPDLCELPDDHAYDPKYHGWNTLDIFNDLKKQQNKPKNKPNGEGEGEGHYGGGFDQHESGENDGRSEEERQDDANKVRDALQQGGMLAALQGHELPRAIDEALAPAHDWKRETQEFMTTTVKGMGEQSYEKYNRKRIIDDLYLPTSISETIKELVFTIDVSGSITQQLLSEAASVISDVCVQIKPEKVRVLFWDTEVRAEQVFTENYDNIAGLLKPQGGGGTHVSCVSNYIVRNKIDPDCVIVLTDGYLESEIKWEIKCPSLWLISEGGTTGFNMPSTGRFVQITR